MSSAATGISNSVPCVRTWWHTPENMLGQATGRMPKAILHPCSRRILSTPRWARTTANARPSIESCSGPISIRGWSTRSVAQPMGAMRWVARDFRSRLPRHLAGGQARASLDGREAGLARAGLPVQPRRPTAKTVTACLVRFNPLLASDVRQSKHAYQTRADVTHDRIGESAGVLSERILTDREQL